ILTPRRQLVPVWRPGHGPDSSRVALERERFPTASCVPHLHRAIVVAGSQPFAVGRPSYGKDSNSGVHVAPNWPAWQCPLAVALEGEQFPTASCLPYFRRPVFTSRRQLFAVRRPGHAPDPTGMAREEDRSPAASCVPYVRRAIVISRRQS